MSKKSDLLKELGWSDELIRHFMVEDAYADEICDQDLIAEVHDSHSVIVTFNADNSSRSSFTISCH